MSTDEQDLAAERDDLAALGAVPERIHIDHGLTGSTASFRAYARALAACECDTLVVA